MKNLPYLIVKEKNKLSTPHPFVWLAEILVDPEDSQYQFFFTDNTQDVLYQGQNYTSYPFELEPPEESSSGKIPSATMKVSRANITLQHAFELCNGAVESPIVLRVVNLNNLNANTPELMLSLSILQTQSEGEWLQLSLGAPSPMRRTFPPYIFINNSCNWFYGSVECGHSGENCDRSWDSCRALNNTRRYGGHKGLELAGWRLV